jgi:hypothetical protein
MITMSITPPRYPAMIPSVIPIPPPIPTEISPTRREILAP